MKRAIKNRQAFTLIEIMIAISLLGGMITLSYFGLNRMQKKVNTAYISNSSEVDINQLVQQLVKLGRSAETCTKESRIDTVTNKLASIELNCFTDSGRVDGSGNKILNNVRYIKLVAEKAIRLQAKDEVTLLWVDRQVFGGNGKYEVSDFVLCNTDEMAVDKTCTILPTEMSTSYIEALNRNKPTTDLKNRYFRFQIVATDSPEKPVYKVQSAFFVRNPAPDGVDYVKATN